MACRKAAYRASVELSEYMEKQQEEKRRAEEKLEEDLRKRWTPPQVFEQCCSQWIAYGHEVQEGGQRGSFPTSTRGCSGGCLKGHPKITLDFITTVEETDEKAEGGEGGGKAVAILSHPLDPFVKYFQEEGKLIPVEEHHDDGKLMYELKTESGLSLSDHATILKTRFASHLIKIASTKATAASLKHQRQLLDQEELEKQAKRQKLQSTPATATLLELVLEICLQHSLLQHLDIAEIAWMRLASKTMGKIAAKMAEAVMKQIRLSYCVSIKLSMSLEEAPIRKVQIQKFQRKFVPLQLLQEDNNHSSSSSNSNSNGTITATATATPTTTTATAASSSFDTYIPEEEDVVEWEIDSNRSSRYLGHPIHVYLEHQDNNNSSSNQGGTSSSSTTTTTTTPTTTSTTSSQSLLFPDDFFLSNPTNPQSSKHKRIFVSSCTISPANQDHKLGRGYKSIPDPKIIYNVISNNRNNNNNNNEQQQQQQQGTTTTTAAATIATGSNSSSSISIRTSSSSSSSNRNHNHHGSFAIESIKFTFGELLGIYVRKKLPIARAQYQSLPANKKTLREKNYVKALAKAAREAPHNSQYFMGEIGWPGT